MAKLKNDVMNEQHLLSAMNNMKGTYTADVHTHTTYKCTMNTHEKLNCHIKHVGSQRLRNEYSCTLMLATVLDDC